MAFQFLKNDEKTINTDNDSHMPPNYLISQKLETNLPFIHKNNSNIRII